MQRFRYYHVLTGIGLLILGGMICNSSKEALAAIGFTPVRDVTNPALQSFSSTHNLIIEPEHNVASEAFNVPTGKRLVIEFVAGSEAGPTSQGAPWAEIEVLDPVSGFRNYPLPVTSQRKDGTYDVYVTFSSTRIYVDPGSTVSIVAYRRTFDDIVYADFIISGHLVNLP